MRTALVPFVHAGVPWAWFGWDAWRRGERIGGDFVEMLVAMTAGLFAAGCLIATWLRRCPGQHALLASMSLAMASPFLAAVLVGLLFEPLEWFAGRPGFLFVWVAVQWPCTLLAAAPVRFVSIMGTVGLLAWLLVRPATSLQWRAAAGGEPR